MTLRSKIIRLAYENPDLREDLLPILAEGVKTAVAKSVTVDGNRYTWKRAGKATKGRAGLGAPPDKFRPWQLMLANSDRDMIIQVTHNRFIPPFQPEPTDPPAWKVMLRFKSLPDEIAKHGTFAQFYLKTRFPSENGDEEGVQEAMNAGVKAWEKLKAERDAKLLDGQR